MAPLGLAGLVLVLCWGVPASGRDVALWRAYIDEASVRIRIPANWIERVIDAERGGELAIDGQSTVSPAGAMGGMQLMSGTWSDMRARTRLGVKLHDWYSNVLAGPLYLQLMYDRLGYPGLFGACNAEPARYAEHLAYGRALPAETHSYMANVVGKYVRRPPSRISGPFGNFFPLSHAVGAAAKPTLPLAARQPRRHPALAIVRGRGRDGSGPSVARDVAYVRFGPVFCSNLEMPTK